MKMLTGFVGILFMIMKIVQTDFESIVRLSESVFNDDKMTKGDVEFALTKAAALVEKEFNATILHVDLLELYGMVENIVLKLEVFPLNRNGMISVSQAYLRFHYTNMAAIQNLTCSKWVHQNCLYTPEQAKSYVNQSESRVLRMLKIIIQGDLMNNGNRSKVEIRGSGITVACIQAKEKDIAEMVTKYSSVVKIPVVDRNATLEDKKIFLYVISYADNLYQFILNQYKVTSGTARCFIEDLQGNFIQLFGGSDEVIMEVNYRNKISSSMWTNITDAPDENNFSFNVSAYNTLDIGVLMIDFVSRIKCKVSVIPIIYNESDTEAVLIVEKRRTIPTLKVVKNQNTTVKVWMYQRYMMMSFGPPENEGDWNFVPSDVNVSCEECMVNADLLIAIEDNGLSSNAVQNMEYALITTFLRQILTRDPQNRAAMIDVSSQEEEFPFVNLTSLFGADAIYDFSNQSNTPLNSTSEETSKIIEFIMMYFDAHSDDNRQKIVFLFSDGFNTNDLELNTNISKSRDKEIHFITFATRKVGTTAKDVLRNIADAQDIFFNSNDLKILEDATSADFEEFSTNMISKYCYGNEQLVYNAALYGLVSAHMYNDTSNEWQRSPDIKMKSVDSSKVVFKSNFLGTFGSNIFAIPPTHIEFEEIFASFSDHLEKTPHVLAANVTLLALTVMLIIVLRRLDINDQLRWTYLPLLDNFRTPINTFYISIYTGFWSSKKLTSMPYIILEGERTKTKAIKLDDGIRKNNFQRWTLSNFILTTDADIGQLLRVKIWHDDVGTSPRWYLDKILIAYEEQRELFLCGNWIAKDRGDGKHYRTLYKSAMALGKGSVRFNSLTHFKFFDDYLWLSLINRPSYSRFTRVQRLICLSALLYLSMLCNAMWYKGSTNAGGSSGIEIGPLKITYREFFVGIASTSITFPLMILMSFLYRRRKFHGEKLSDDATLPWWCIFIAYGIGGLIILFSIVFTTLYSLQWGRNISIQWLTAFVLGTSQSIFFLDPLKIIIISSVIACVFKKFANNKILEMAPWYSTNTLSKESPDFESLIQSPRKDDLHKLPIFPGNDPDMENRRIRLRYLLDHKLYILLRELLILGAYVTLLAILCGHNAITDSYNQNQAIKEELTPNHKINNSDDMWKWIMNDYTESMYPKLYINGDVKPLEERQYMLDDVSYKVGISRIRQLRVKGSCNIPGRMTSVITRCSLPYSDKNKENGSFCPGWLPYSDICAGQGFDFTEASDGNSIFPLQGKHASYGSNGYIKLLDPSTSDVRNDFFALKHRQWTDGNTRLVALETVIMNINNKLFTYLRIIFEHASFGGIHTMLQVETMRLYPYIDAFDFVVLGLQVIFLITTFCRLFHFLYELCGRKRRIKEVSTWTNFFSVMISISTCVIYTVKVLKTIQVVEEIVNNKDKYVTFDVVADLDYIYKLCISMELFISILKLLTPMTFNYYLYLMRTSLVISAMELLSFAVFLLIGMTAFAHAFVLSFGSYAYDFKDMISAYMALLRTLLSHMTYKEAFGIDMSTIVGNVAFVFFVFSIAIFTVNILVAILTYAFHRVQMEMDKRQMDSSYPVFDRELNEHIWRIINDKMELLRKLIEKDETMKGQNQDVPNLPDEHNVMENVIKLDNIISILDKDDRLYCSETGDSRKVFNLCNIITSVEKKNEIFEDVCKKMRNEQ